MTRATLASCADHATGDSLARPLVVSLHRPEAVSGINAWGARMAGLGEPHARWHVLVVGEELTRERGAAAARGAPAWSVASWRRGAGAVEQVRAVREALRGLGADVVAPNDVAHGFVCAGLDHHRGLRSLAVCHACSGVDEDFYARVGALADAWVPVSERARVRLGPFLARDGQPAPPVVPCGVVVAAEARPPLPGPGPLRLLFVGRLDQHCKRVLDLPVLCDHLTRLGVDWTLTVAGDGSAREELARGLAPFIAAGRAAMLGLVQGGDMPALYAGADCLVLLSAFEGWPVTVIEALAASRPVAITTGCGGALDAVRDGVEGIVVPTGDMEGMARRLAGAGREGLARMGAAAHAAARAHLDLRAQAAIYDSLVGMAMRMQGADGRGAVAQEWERILVAMSAIEPAATPDELRSLLLEWVHDLGDGEERVNTGLMGLPLAIPDRPNFASACFLRAMERLRAKGVLRVVLYGAGRHTRRLAGVLPRTPEVVGIVDDRAGEGAPERLLGYPVMKPAALASLAAEAVVISSDEHQEAMAARAAGWAGTVPIVRLYSSDGYSL